MSCGQHRLELTQLIELISACRPIRLALKCIVSSPNIGCGHTITNAPHPFPNCEAKCDWVSIVVVWGTDREQDDAATFFFIFFRNPLSSENAFLYPYFHAIRIDIQVHFNSRCHLSPIELEHLFTLFSSIRLRSLKQTHYSLQLSSGPITIP